MNCPGKFAVSPIHNAIAMLGCELSLPAFFFARKRLNSQEPDVDLFSLLVYPLRSRGKDGHFADAQIVSG